MIARFAADIILSVGAAVGFYFLYTKFLHSRLFGAAIEAAKPESGIPTDDDVSRAFDAADLNAEQRAVANETEAAAKAASASKLRARRAPKS